MIEPLGVFGVVAGQPEFERLRGELSALVGVIPEAERPSIGKYLRSGAIVFAIMEHTRDILGQAFQVAGGSAILTDGAFYWRLEAADYVEHYGVALPEAFLERGRTIGWSARSLTKDEVLRIDRYLMEHAHRLRGEEP
jgi:hypothetical protein